MKVNLAYGEGHLSVELPEERTTVIRPTSITGLPNERAAVIESLDHPMGSPSLKELAQAAQRICLSFSDSTRPTPNHRLIPWILDYLSPIPRENIVLLIQTGTHRASPPDELERLLTPEVVKQYRVLNHEPENLDAHLRMGSLGDGAPAWINRHVVEADLRIVTGFIEPHFFAGFSGGPKGIIPGTAALETVMSNHGTRNISHPNATWGVTAGNPLWEELRDAALRVGPTFLLNVTLNETKRITRVFGGGLIQAHQAGCEFVRQSAMQKVERPFDLVITTNSGAPLDLNLYQGVKGISAAARIVKPGGTIILACECREGVPSGSPMDRLLRSVAGPDALLAKLAQPGFQYPEQWQAQILAQIQQRATVLVKSSLPDEEIRALHLAPCADIRAEVETRLESLGPSATVAVLPQGPQTVPYLS